MGRSGGGRRSGGGGGSRSRSTASRSTGRSTGFRSTSSTHRHYTSYSSGTYYGGGSAVTYVRTSPRRVCGIFNCCCLLIFVIVIASVTPRAFNETVELTAMENVLVNPGTTWRSGVTVNINEPGTITAYLFANIPPISSQKLTKNETRPVSVNSMSYEFWAYRLTRTSTVQLTYALNGNLYFYVIRGRGNFDTWKNDDSSTAGVIKQQYGSTFTYSFTATSDDDYYFVWESNTGVSASGTVNFFIQLATYDLSNPVDFCSIDICEFEFRHGSKDCVVLHANDNPNPDEVFRASYKVHPRSSYYWAIFGSILAVWVFLTVIIALAVYYLFKRVSGSSSSTTTTGLSRVEQSPVQLEANYPYSTPAPPSTSTAAPYTTPYTAPTAPYTSPTPAPYTAQPYSAPPYNPEIRPYNPEIDQPAQTSPIPPPNYTQPQQYNY